MASHKPETPATVREKFLFLTYFLIGIVFVVEASVVLYVLGLFPPAVVQASPEMQQFVLMGWGYAIIKLVVGLLALAAASYNLLRR